MYLDRKLFRRHLARHTRKRVLSACICEISQHSGGEWSGGSRSTYIPIDLDTGATGQWEDVDQRHAGGPFPSFTAGFSLTSPGRGVLQGGTSSGKPSYITIDVHPGDLWMLFDCPQGSDEEVIEWLRGKGADVGMLEYQLERIADDRAARADA